MNRKVRKYLSFLMALALVLTSVVWPQTEQSAKAAEGRDVSPEDAVAILDESGNLGHETIQEFSLKDLQVADAGLTYEKVKNTKVKVYIHVTQSYEYSYLKVRCGDIVTNSFSNKELVGPLCTKKSGSNSPFILHLGYGTDAASGAGIGGYGSGLGEKGSGNYLFADAGINKAAIASQAGIRLTRRTNDVEAYIIGIEFGSEASFSLSAPDADGNVTITKGFDAAAANVESHELDRTDLNPAEAADALKDVIKEAKKYTKDSLLDEAVWNSLQKTIADAEAIAGEEGADVNRIQDLKELLEAEMKKADADIERKVTREGFLSSINYCKSLKAENYSAESFAKLAPAIEAAEAAYNKTDDTRLGYKEKRDALEAVRVALVPKVSTAESNPRDFRILSKAQVVEEMGSGINLGNTMDGGLYDVTETSWQAYKTTKEYIKALHDAGYNTVRIPVTWGKWIKEDYTIDESWIGRVQEIVDYCVDQDMYAIVNIHHDGAANHDDRGNNPECWLNTYEQDIEKVYQKYEGVWKTIAERFKDYDEHLIFESMNEVTDSHGKQTNEDTAVLNALNQLFVNTVRATGSNNLKRWLGITGRFATYSTGTVLPEDTLADKGEVGTTRMMFSVHIYKSNTATSWSLSNLKDWQGSLSSSTNNVKKLDPEMPLYVGEYGVRTQALKGSATGYNNTERALNYEFCTAVSAFYGAVPIVWDQGTGNYSGVKTETGLFTDWNRPALKPVYDNVVWATIRGSLESGRSTDLNELMETIYKSYGHAKTTDVGISTDPEITPATEITVTTEEGVPAENLISLKEGERINLKAVADSSRDIVLWSTDNDAVATVYNGRIHAKGAGNTTVYAKTQQSDVVKEFNIVVQSGQIIESDEIILAETEYTVEEGKTAEIDVKLKSSDSKQGLSFASSNEEVMTVNKDGVVTAKAQGTAYVIISSNTGVAEIVKITVPKNTLHESVSLALMVYKNGAGYPGDPITISKDGQYTVTWDLAKNKPDTVDKFELKDLVSVYVYDQNASAMVVKEAQIRYDEFKVDDTALTITKGDFKSALKASGEFDTNDPVNGWDGSAVKEVAVSGEHTVSFTTVPNPTKLSLTFTIQGLKFGEISTLKKNEATEMKSAIDTTVAIENPGDKAELDVQLTPADTDSLVTFFAKNPSVISVKNQALPVDETGHVKTEITALSGGTTQVVGITENGLMVEYTVTVAGTGPIPPSAEPTSEPSEQPSTPPSEKPSEKPSEPPIEPTAPVTPPDTQPTAPPPAGTVVPQPTQTAVTVPATTPAITSDKDSNTPKNQTVDGAKYSIVSASAKTVEYKGPTSKSKKSVTIPATVKVKIKGKKTKCKVVSVAKNAFKNNTKVQKITVGKNVKEIKANAFSGCKNLKSIVIKSIVLKKVGKNALKGVSAKCKIVVPKKKRKAYTKLFKGKGQAATVKVVTA